MIALSRQAAAVKLAAKTVSWLQMPVLVVDTFRHPDQPLNIIISLISIL